MPMSAARLPRYGNEIELVTQPIPTGSASMSTIDYGKHGDAEHGYDASFECLIYDV